MKASGIVVEYNPLHNGHKLHINKTREITQCDVLVAVMSGNFVQRGEMAIVDKFKRAEAAIHAGADLVIELPYIYCTQSAQQFAQGSIHLLNLAKVSSIVFGSESNDLEKLKEIASMSFKVDYLKEALSAGEGYAKAYGLGTSVMQANDILAVAYLKEIAKTNITPYTIQRTTHYHDENLHQNISSATAIRKAYFNDNDISQDVAMEISEPTVNWNQFYPTLRLLLQTLSPDYIKSIFLFNEGIENHLAKQAQISNTWQQFIDSSCTKRYTKARIQRSCLHLLNQVTKEDVANLEENDTIRVLAFNETGQQYLRHLRDEEVKVASRFADLPFNQRELELKTTKLYSSFMSITDQRKLIELEIGGIKKTVLK